MIFKTILRVSDNSFRYSVSTQKTTNFCRGWMHLGFSHNGHVGKQFEKSGRCSKPDATDVECVAAIKLNRCGLSLDDHIFYEWKFLKETLIKSGLWPNTKV